MRTIEKWQLAYYDEYGCYDEWFINPWDINEVASAFDSIIPGAPHVVGDYERLFVIFDDGTKKEVKLMEVE